MQVNFSILVIFVSTCFLGIIAIPVSVEQISNIIIRPGWPIIESLCRIGNTCKNDTDCCKNFACGDAIGYDNNPKQCCGLSGVTGCNMTSPYVGSGCCYRH